MTDTLWMLQGLDVASLVPEIYAEFRPMVTDALEFFLHHLSAPRLNLILREQLTLPPTADLPTRIVHFMHHCPALHKLGQVIARHRALDPAFRHQLQRLESMTPLTPMPVLLPIIHDEMGDALRRYHIEMDQTPLAEASVAVVVPINWRMPHDARTREGVLKILKPGIIRQLNEDLHILALLADHFDRQKSTMSVPNVAYRQTLDEVRELLTHEVCLREEQRHLADMSRRYAHDSQVEIPSPLPFSTDAITAMSRVYGRKVTQVACEATSFRRRLAETAVRVLLTDVIFSRWTVVPFHADPHAGNLFATENGRLAILDWSLAGRLGQSDRAALMQVLIGAVSLDAGRIGRAVESLAAAPPDPNVLRNHIDDSLAKLRGGHFPGVGWLMRFMDRLARNGIRFSSDLLLFRKTYFTLEGVVHDIYPEQPIEQILMVQAAAQVAFEWPRRLVHPPMSRDFPSQLSNMDLARIAAGVPVHLLRAWF